MYRVEFSAGFCIEIDKLIPRFTWKCKGPKAISAILKSERTYTTWFQDFYTTLSGTGIKIDK